jgi:hypothetical protein
VPGLVAREKVFLWLNLGLVNWEVVRWSGGEVFPNCPDHLTTSQLTSPRFIQKEPKNKAVFYHRKEVVSRKMEWR